MRRKGEEQEETGPYGQVTKKDLPRFHPTGGSNHYESGLALLTRANIQPSPNIPTSNQFIMDAKSQWDTVPAV